MAQSYARAALVNHLKKAHDQHHTFYKALQLVSTPATDDEQRQAMGIIPITTADTDKHVEALSSREQTLDTLWAKQAEVQQVSNLLDLAEPTLTYRRPHLTRSTSRACW
jgi:hypothetical protein